MNEYYLNGVSNFIENNFHLIRFVDQEHLPLCKKGDFLIGSIQRNRDFDGKRGDKGESTITISLDSPDGWYFEGSDLKRYTGLSPGKKFAGLHSTGSLTLNSHSLFDGNLPSLSFAIISKNCGIEQKIKEAEKIRENLGYPKDAACLLIKSPKNLVKLITKCLQSDKCTTSRRLAPISGLINYFPRIINTASVNQYKAVVDKIFHSGSLHIDYMFAKPEDYQGDKEFRVIWIGHSGGSSEDIRPPLATNIFLHDYVILNDIDFAKNFMELDALK